MGHGGNDAPSEEVGFEQAESESDAGTASTGWETFLDAVIRAGFATSGTWPMRTELGNRTRGMGSHGSTRVWLSLRTKLCT